MPLITCSIGGVFQNALAVDTGTEDRPYYPSLLSHAHRRMNRSPI